MVSFVSSQETVAFSIFVSLLSHHIWLVSGCLEAAFGGPFRSRRIMCERVRALCKTSVGTLPILNIES